MKYNEPEMKIVQVEVVDIITDSFGGVENGTPDGEPTVDTPEFWG